MSSPMKHFHLTGLSCRPKKLLHIEVVYKLKEYNQTLFCCTNASSIDTLLCKLTINF